MRARWRKTTSGAGHANRLWPVLILLVLLILVPTVCVLWFMNAAVQNEHLAVREKLRDAYQSHLALTRERLEDDWRTTLRTVDRLTEKSSCSMAFDSCVRQGLCDSILCFDEDGRQGYPAEVRTTDDTFYQDDDWQEAIELEYVRQDYEAAAERYQRIARSCAESQLNRAARSWQAAARCYAQADRDQEALNILNDVLDQPRFAKAIDRQGRLIVADTELRALELLKDASSPNARLVVDRLRERLIDYSNPYLGAAQRRFLMSRLHELDPTVDFPTRSAEQLATRLIDSRFTTTRRAVLSPTGLPDVWQIASTNGQAVLLFEQATLDVKTRRVLSSQPLPQEVVVKLAPASEKHLQDDVFIAVPAGAMLPGWRLTLALNDRDIFANTSHARVTSYFWTGMLGIALIAGLALIIGHLLRNQSRLATLKNDLVATITHELKTPLASMRLLVDTLLEQDEVDAGQVREYLQLIGKENMRLSRLIDNFLAFSRIERNRYRFAFASTAPATIIEAVEDSVHERFQAPQCHFALEVDADLPDIVVDSDAIVTVLLNLLDNAYKYSGDEKQICLRAYRSSEAVCFDVEDNGIGMSLREQNRVFRRFYQANQRLSRSVEGCGLGLSIVEYIVQAHGGRIELMSWPDQGSKFMIKLPIATSLTPKISADVIS